MTFIGNKIKAAFKRLSRSYAIDLRGSIAPMFAIVLPVLVGATGMAVEVAQSYLVKERLSHALDSAALAGAASSADPETIKKRVEDFFYMNYPPEKVGTTYDLEVEVVGEKVNVKAKAKFHTNFLRAINISAVPVSAQTEVTREVQGIEVVLVLDVTGSMASGSRYIELQKAAYEFINTLYSRVKDPAYLRIGIVPYASTVNVGSVAPELVGADPSTGQIPGLPAGVIYDPEDETQWAGCVYARDPDDDVLDTDMDDGGLWDPFWWAHSETNQWDSSVDEDAEIDTRHEITYQTDDGYEIARVTSTLGNNKTTPNLGCPVDNPIVPLTNDRTVLDTATRNLTYWNRGGTFGSVGMAWGWRVLSPMEPFTQGRSYDDPYWRKYALIMTDGDNGFYCHTNGNCSSGRPQDDTAYGMLRDNRLGTTSKGNATTKIDDKFVEICENMKDEGISLYSIVFKASGNTEEVFKSCSGESNYNFVEEADELKDVFAMVAKEISNLHISQ